LEEFIVFETYNEEISLAVTIFLRLRLLCCGILALATIAANATVGLTEITGTSTDGPVTVFYPTDSPSAPVVRGPFTLDVALQGPPSYGNGRLVVISHGSPASPWVYFDLAHALVDAGFVVALPEHFADNYKDDSEPGPRSWKRRPLEVSRSIDTMAADPRFQPLLKLDKVGMYGMSAGGHTALTLAGGRWSPSQLRLHCTANMAEDFQACAGPSMRLTGGILDGIKMAIVRRINEAKLADAAWYHHTDARITAVVAGVPFAADFDAASLASPSVHLGIISARLDKWLAPKYHSDAIVKACTGCERVADIEQGGHGALLSPLLPNRSGVLSDLIADPSAFDRANEVPQVNRKIADFFIRHLLNEKAP
jgi:predicted dienelactone hydrolase